VSELRKALAEFRETIHQEGEQRQVPALETILGIGRPAQVLQLRWALAAMVIVYLGAIPVYQNARQQQRETEQELADAMLMERVNAAVSRPVPRALSPLMGN
jgi:thiamine biosynthesis protein ThiC